MAENADADADADIRRLQAKQHETCLNLSEQALRRHPRTQFLVQAIEKLGCPLPKSLLRCQKCTESRATGGFTLDKEGKPTVVLCEDVPIMGQKRVMQATVAHELVHAYDACRIKADFNNCLHLACTEVRASNLSGECHWVMEMDRGHFNISKQQEACVKRRAQLSLEGHPECRERAAEFVRAAWAPCSEDTEPFHFNPHP